MSMEMSRLTRGGTAEPVSRDQILRLERGQGNIHFRCSADHVQDWQPYPVDPYTLLAICVTIQNGDSTTGKKTVIFLSSAEHEQDWQPYLVDHYSCYDM